MVVLIFMLGSFASPNLGLQESSERNPSDNLFEDVLLDDYGNMTVDYDTTAMTDAPSPSPTEYNISTFEADTYVETRNRENADGGSNFADQVTIRPGMSSFDFNGTVHIDVTISIILKVWFYLKL